MRINDIWRPYLERVAIIDIGSNTIRLVVFSVANKFPMPMFNEKATCRLGAGLIATGKLAPDSMSRAVSSIERFVLIAQAMEVCRLVLVATAAVRLAKNGDTLVNIVKKRCNVDVEILSGAEEARLASLGVTYGIPNADGLICDLGGGSADLVLLDSGTTREFGSLALGHVVLAESSKNNINKARKLINQKLDMLPWIACGKERSLYAVGGSVRALAKLYIHQSGYPIHIVDEFTMRSSTLYDFSKVVSKMSPNSLVNSPSISRKRINTFPMAALFMECIIERSKVKDVIFCSSGMREGKLISLLPNLFKDADPLIVACERISELHGRFLLPGRELFNWISPLFVNDVDHHQSCRLAACLLSDICWYEHPDYRAEHAFYRTLRLRVVGISHTQRVFLSLALYVRYGGKLSDDIVSSITSLIDKDALNGATVTGIALKLGHALAGSAPGILWRSFLKLDKEFVVLTSKDDPCIMRGEVVKRELKSLARSLSLSWKIEYSD